MNVNMPIRLQASGLHFAYAERKILENWTAELPAGVTLVRCDDSRGKTTLLRLLAGELRPLKGQLAIDSIVQSEEPERYRSQIFFIDPRTEAYDQISPVAFWAELIPRFPALNQKKLEELSEGMGLAPHQHKPLFMLSAGSRRKVWITAALACGAPVSLIDDLFAALDQNSIKFITAQLALAAKEQNRTIVVTHYDMLEGVPLATIIEL